MLVSAVGVWQGSSRSVRGSSGSLKTLHMFQLSLLDSKIPPRNVLGEHGEVHKTNGWVFACKSLEEAQEWVSAINNTSELASSGLPHEPEVNMTLKASPHCTMILSICYDGSLCNLSMQVDEATGGLVEVDATALQMQASRGRKLSVLAKKYIHRWIRMVPDDLELLHR